MRATFAGLAALFALDAASPARAAPDEAAALAALQGEIARVRQLDPARRVLKADATLCATLDQWHRAVTALMRGDLAGVDASPGCRRVPKPVPVEVLDFPNPLTAEVRATEATPGLPAQGFTMPAAIVDSAGAGRERERRLPR